MLSHKAYYGIQEWNGKEYKIKHEKFIPIISKKIYDTANKIKSSRESKLTESPKEEVKYTFRGLVKDK